MLTLISIFAWNRPRRFFHLGITPYQARGLICFGGIGMVLLPSFALFCEYIFERQIDPKFWFYLWLGGYGAGCVGFCRTQTFSARQVEYYYAREQAALAPPPQPPPASRTAEDIRLRGLAGPAGLGPQMKLLRLYEIYWMFSSHMEQRKAWHDAAEARQSRARAEAMAAAQLEAMLIANPSGSLGRSMLNDPDSLEESGLL